MTAQEYIKSKRQEESLITYGELTEELGFSCYDEIANNSLMLHPLFWGGAIDYNGWGWNEEKKQCEVDWFTYSGFVKFCLILIHDQKVTSKRANQISKKYFSKSINNVEIFRI